MMELNNVLPIRKQDEVIHKILERKVRHAAAGSHAQSRYRYVGDPLPGR